MEKSIANILENMSVDEQLDFIGKNLLNEDLSTNNSELLNESNMTDEQCFKYLLRQDKGFMTMEEFERLGTKAIQELFPQ
jgi:hypothetical protein